MPTIIDGSLGLTTPTYGGADTSEYLVPVTQFKNRIINGAMTIDQRNAGASVTPVDAQYTVDRWAAFLSQASKYTVQQNAGTVTPPAGFNNYLGLTVGASANVTVGANDYFAIAQYIEGFNVADLDFGNANAKTVTLSFWVRSSLTGTFGGVLRNGASNRSYPYSYTISSANTWEYKTVTVAGDTTGTWLKTNGIGLAVFFSIGVGSNFLGTAGSWATAAFASATGSTNLISTNNATFYITGVQLEVGSTATSFDYRPYGTELLLCQRYCQKNQVASGKGGGGTVGAFYVPLVPTMRDAPTMTLLTGTNKVDEIYVTQRSVTSVGSLFGNNDPGISQSITLNMSGGNTSNQLSLFSGCVILSAEL